jgi:hypothetical protein
MNNVNPTKVEHHHFPGHVVFKEPLLSFSCNDPRVVSEHPLMGLSQFGPFSASQLAAIPNPIKVALVSPFGRTNELKKFINELNTAHSPKERKDYLIDYSGFSNIYKTTLVSADEHACIELPQVLDKEIYESETPHLVLADAITRTLQSLRNLQHEFTIVLLLIPNRWKRAFKVKNELEDFDLHHYLKAISASMNMPLQITNDDDSGALRYFCRCSVMWRASIAIYTKAGGIPWVLANSPEDTAYIGLRYALQNNPNGKSKFAICCSQVFDASGAGLEFIAYEAEDVRIFGDNPFLNRSQMLSVISRSIEIYQRKHFGRKPKHVIIHKNTEFKPEEIDGCFDALTAVDEVDLIHIKQDTPWSAIHLNNYGGKISLDGYPCKRGTSLQLGGHNSLLWIHGASSILSNNKKQLLKGGKGIPSPVELVRYAGHGSMDEIAKSILALSKMDWNNDGPYVQLPVTLSYAHIMAQIVARMPKLESRPYPIRFFM